METDVPRPFWLQAAADDFWRAAGEVEPFPRTLEAPVLWALPLFIVKVPRLTLSDVRAKLADYGIAFGVDGPNRNLYGCLVAFAGKGVVMLDGSEPPDELRFSLAHEVGHFIIDYLRPRDRALRRLGPDIVDVLDGLRSPNQEERIDAVLSDVRIGVHTHLMDRTPSGAIGCGRISGSEFRADRLAFELLAPEQAVLAGANTSGFASAADDAAAALRAVLVEVFGLPVASARQYAHFLNNLGERRPSMRAWLGMDSAGDDARAKSRPNLSNFPAHSRKRLT
jgi:hypothetical protein